MLCKQVVSDSHSRFGFHFKVHQLEPMLKPLIYHPNLSNLIHDVVQKCLICTMTPPKRIRKLIGLQRSNVHMPGQCTVIDCFYLPTSRYGYTKGLILVDSATGYVTVYPCLNLQAASIRRNILWYLCSRHPPEIIKAEFGKEFLGNLEGFLGRYGIALHSTMPYAKG